MKRITKITAITFILVSTLHAEQQAYVLESGVLRIVDGSFFNADSIELIRALQRKLLAILVGPSMYEYEGTKCNVKELVVIEQRLREQQTNTTPEEYALHMQHLTACLEHIKNDFIIISDEFRSAAQGAKPAMAKLIEESCTKRQRSNSVLITVAKAPENQENDTFKQAITSVGQFEQLCIDLLNFLHDLNHSCPKAQAQFKQRIEKWNKIKEYLTTLERDIKVHDNPAFLHYIKMHHLDKLSLADISHKKIRGLFQEFLKEKSAPAA